MKKAFLNILIYIFIPSFIPMLFTSNINSKKYFIIVFIIYILLALYFLIKYKKDLVNDIKKFNYKKIKNVFIIFILGLGLEIISNYVIGKFFIQNSISNNELGNRQLINNYKLIYPLLLITIIPFIEEIIFRFEFKKHISNKYVYLFLTSSLFAIIHLLSNTSIIELLYFIPYFILGYTFALIYYKTDNICYSIGSHMLNNLIAIIYILIL